MYVQYHCHKPFKLFSNIKNYVIIMHVDINVNAVQIIQIVVY